MKKIIVLLGIAIVFFLLSCQKDDNQADDSVSLLKSAEIAVIDDKFEVAMTEVEYEADFYAGIERTLWNRHRMGISWAWSKMLRYKMGHCPSVNITGTGTGYPKTITLDYGDGTETNHGRILKGVITIEITAPPRTDGYRRTVTYQDYSVDSLTINGKTEVLFTGDNENAAKHDYTSDITFTMDNGKEATWKAKKTREWVEGLSTEMDMSDDVINITGEVNAATFNGDTYTKKIVTPLVRKGTCRVIVEGVVELTVNGTVVSTLDYGDGECDGKATLTKNGETVEIDLVKHKYHFKGK